MNRKIMANVLIATMDVDRNPRTRPVRHRMCHKTVEKRKKS